MCQWLWLAQAAARKLTYDSAAVMPASPGAAKESHGPQRYVCVMKPAIRPIKRPTLTTGLASGTIPISSLTNCLITLSPVVLVVVHLGEAAISTITCAQLARGRSVTANALFYVLSKKLKQQASFRDICEVSEKGRRQLYSARRGDPAEAVNLWRTGLARGCRNRL
ncbi:hypothetical protein MRX96_037404 [Rhipicephalus microplus]